MHANNYRNFISLRGQCFDLRNYLSINQFISGTRWRCACCESFVSIYNLEYCSFTKYLIDEFRTKVTWNRDRVEFCSDGTSQLLEPQKTRRQKISIPSWIAIKLEGKKCESSNRNDDIVIELE
jgi:hypothetical protein